MNAVVETDRESFGRRSARWVVFLLAAAFLIAAVDLVARTSFVARDGHRYFILDDDAMVSMRYAWNLAHGHGLVWNAGERVEGFTNPLWTLYASAWAAVLPRRLMPLAVLASGMILLLAHATVLARIVRVSSAERGRSTPWLETAAFALPLAYYPLVYWSVQGLEVCLLGFLVALAVLYYLRHRWVAAAVALGLAFWTRPDSAIPAAAVMGVAGIEALRARGLLRSWLKACAVLAGMVAAIFIARELYYGRAWPNTYVLKMRHFALMDRIKLNGIGYIRPFLRENAVAIGLALLTLVVGWSWPRCLLAGIVLSMAAYSVYVGGDALPHWRFIAPYVPFLGLVLLIDGSKAPRPAPYRRILQAAMVAAVLATWLTVSVKPLYKLSRGPRRIERANIELALELNRLLKPGASIGVFHAGTLPYYTDFRAIDFLGKCDPVIARLSPDLTKVPHWDGMNSPPGHNKYNLVHSIVDGKPTFIQGAVWGGENEMEYVRAHYAFVSNEIQSYFTGNALLLLDNSPDVRWELITRGQVEPSLFASRQLGKAP